MAELTPDIVEQVVAACTEGAEEAAEALERALDAEISVAVGESGTIDAEQMPDGLVGPGLVLTFTIGTSSAALLLPESSELLPEWYANPDLTGQSKLSTLALELGMVLLPGDTIPDSSNTLAVGDLTKSLQRGKLGDGVAVVSLELYAGEKKAVASLIWPLADAAAMADGETDEPEVSEDEAAADQTAPQEPPPKAPPSAEAKPIPQPAAFQPAKSNGKPATLDALPRYSRSLLRIKVPVVVTLADKRQSLGRIVELGPGSIIQFEKSCEEMLELSVGGQSVATGEAVKVGDKFGLRVTEMILPEERFTKVTSE